MQPPLGQGLTGEKVRDKGNAVPIDGGHEHGFHIVQGHRGGQAQPGECGVGGQGPVHDFAGGGKPVTQAGVVFQVLHRQRPAMALEIFRRRTQQKPERPEPTRHQLRIRQAAAADRHIDALLDHVHQQVVEIQLQLNLRVGAAECRHVRHEEAIADGGQTHPQLATGLLDHMGEHGLRVLQVVEDFPTTLVKQLPLRRQTDFARTALQQPHIQRRFQLGDVFTDCRRRNPQAPRRRDKTEGLCRFNEGNHTTQAVH